MKNLNITQGKARLATVPRDSGRFQIETENTVIAYTVNKGYSEKPLEEEKANADLFLQAHNIAIDTGLSPKMMQERIEQYKKAFDTIEALLNGEYDNPLVVALGHLYHNIEMNISDVLKSLQSIQKGGNNG